ncbi:MAG: hypothetical protein P9M14_13000 [Candidatus Alcyoniella australis]|nr:hypothetical protein [Candidatus Alcyoniella australis]
MTGEQNTAQPRGALFAVFYAARALALVLVGAALFVHLLRSRVSIEDQSGLFDLVTSLDLFRALFYAALPAAVLLLLTPGRRKPWGHWAVALASCAALSAVAAWLLQYAVDAVRPRPHPDNGFGLAGLYLALNVFCVLYFHVGGRMGRRLQRALIQCVGPADLLLPSAVWAAFRREGGRSFAALRPLPMLLVLAVPFAPWALNPQPFPDLPQPAPGFERLSNEPSNIYQVLTDAHDALLVTANNERIYRFDPRSGARSELAFGGLDGIQALAVREGGLVYCDPAVGRILLIDAQGRFVEQEIELSNPLPQDALGNLWRTLYDGRQGVLASYCMEYLALLDPQGGRVLANTTDYYADALIDPSRPEIHATRFDPGRLISYDAHTLEIKRSLELPRFPERIAVDGPTDRLIVALPMRGRIISIDLEQYRVLDGAGSFPGVRVIALDVVARRIYLGGFAPVLEVRDLDDLSLIDRIKAPPWIRWIALDQGDNALYCTSGRFGLYRLDLRGLGDGSAANLLRRLDPFYPLVCWASRELQSLLGWD